MEENTTGSAGNNDGVLPDPNRATGQLKHLDLTFLEQISSGKENFLLESLELFKTESSEFIEKVILQLSQNDFYALAKTAHAMKPTGSYIGVDELTSKITALEKVASKGDHASIRNLVPEIANLVKEINTEIDYYLTKGEKRS
jgi:HPt (histidine-containing phosphotransfer) domain-containing protein